MWLSGTTLLGTEDIDAKYIGNKLNDYLMSKEVSNEYREIYYEIHITFKSNSDIIKYTFQKDKTCFECKNQKCGCTCIIDGRVRRLQLIIDYSHDIFQKFDSCIIYEDAENETNGKISFSSNGMKFEADTKVIWAWCKRQIKIGEFTDGPRKVTAKIRSSPEIYCDSPLNDIMNIRGGEVQYG